MDLGKLLADVKERVSELRDTKDSLSGKLDKLVEKRAKADDIEAALRAEIKENNRELFLLVDQLKSAK